MSLDNQKPFLPLSRETYAKLRELYGRHGRRGREIEDEKWTALFHQRLWVLLARYDAIKGDIYQSALSGPAFDLLKAELKVEGEGFASALNCRFGRYCSAYPDVEGAFGSVGTFFDFRPRQVHESSCPTHSPRLSPNDPNSPE